MNAKSAISTATVASAVGYPPSWRISARSVDPTSPPLESSIALAIEMITAGICVTSPSPTVRIE